MNQPNQEIVQEIYRSLVLLGAESDILGTVGSWGDSLSDEQVLSGLRAWNYATAQQVRGRIEHYETSSRQSDYTQVEYREMAFQER